MVSARGPDTKVSHRSCCSAGSSAHREVLRTRHFSSPQPQQTPGRTPHLSGAAPAARRWAPSPCSEPGHWPLASGGPCSLSEGRLQTWAERPCWTPEPGPTTIHYSPLPTPSTPDGPSDTYCTRSFSSQEVRIRSVKRQRCSSCGGVEGKRWVSGAVGMRSWAAPLHLPPQLGFLQGALSPCCLQCVRPGHFLPACTHAASS